MADRIIFHIDVNNAFLSWTAVYLLKNGYHQDIRKIPSVIGGDSKERRGVVLAKSPVAKKYNVLSAEPIYQAKKKCPSLQVFPPNYSWYSEKSKELFKYLSKYSPIMERFSIDECFLDMTGTNYLYKDYFKLANFIKDDIKKRFGYTVNVGIGNNKLCAKMASDFEKPDKVHTLLKDEIEEKLWPLNVGDLLMVGKSSKTLLNKLNIYTIEDLAKANDKILEKHFKNQATYLKRAAFGIDYSNVEEKKERTSISTSETLPYDSNNKEKLKEKLFVFAEELTRELREKKQYAKTVAIIYKTNNFISSTSQAKLENSTNNFKDIYKLALEIFDKSYKEEPLRLIGLRLSDLTTNSDRQLSLFDTDHQEKNDNIQETMDIINKKFGKSIIVPASLNYMCKTKEKLHK